MQKSSAGKYTVQLKIPFPAFRFAYLPDTASDLLFNLLRYYDSFRIPLNLPYSSFLLYIITDRL